ncbi:hypothetical protein BDZ45DRAFT_744410 [Acephala macrosclerotiorum]|nr:hypothetical protein BDZ45DRAFT_744410 [Acephala macrosclerotiorum]
MVKAYARRFCLDMFEDYIPTASLPTFARSVESLRQIPNRVVFLTSRLADFLIGAGPIFPISNLSLPRTAAEASPQLPPDLEMKYTFFWIAIRQCSCGLRLKEDILWLVCVIYLACSLGGSILGNLSQGVRLTNRWNEDGSQWERGFEDSSAGQFFYEDRRLEAVIENYDEYYRYT